MATNAMIAHRIPGRIRLIIHAKRGDSDYFADLSESLSRFPNVQSTRANPTTGSIALNFIGSLEDILQRAEQEDLLSIVDGVATGSDSPAPARSSASPINLVSGRDINRMFMIGSVLMIIAGYQALRGQVFPPALSVFWFAMDAFRQAGKLH